MVKKENTTPANEADLKQSEDSGSSYDSNDDGSSDMNPSKQHSLAKKQSSLSKPK